MRFRPGFDIPFLCIEAILMGGHYVFPELPRVVGQIMFWVGVAGLIIWVCARLGVFDNLRILRRFIAAPVQRDTELSAAAAYVSYRDWKHTFFEAATTTGVNAQAVPNEVRQAAADGLIPIWGKHSAESDVYVEIPAHHWRTHQLEWFGLLRGVVHAEHAPGATDHGEQFNELMTSRTAVERVWPRQRTRTAFRVPWAKTTQA